MSYRIGIVLFEDVEELDWAGPREVLSMWATWFPDDAVEVVTVSVADLEVRCALGTRVLADHSLDDAPPLDVIVYPGGFGTRSHLDDERILGWVRDQARSGALMTSVCTGALVYAKAGLLDGRPATTHWAALEELGTLGDDIDVRPDDRFVDDGDVVTAAGVSAGIDMSLHLVDRLAGTETARTVRRFMQYDPEPPV